MDIPHISSIALFLFQSLLLLSLLLVNFVAVSPLFVEPLPKPEEPNFIVFTIPEAGISWSGTWDAKDGKDSRKGRGRVRQEYEIEEGQKLYLPKGNRNKLKVKKLCNRQQVIHQQGRRYNITTAV